MFRQCWNVSVVSTAAGAPAPSLPSVACTSQENEHAQYFHTQLPWSGDGLGTGGRCRRGQRCQRDVEEDKRTLVGAVVGGVAGNLLSNGDPAATVGGAVAGGAIGNLTTSDRRDRRYYDNRRYDDRYDRRYDRGYYRSGYYDRGDDRRWQRERYYDNRYYHDRGRHRGW